MYLERMKREAHAPVKNQTDSTENWENYGQNVKIRRWENSWKLHLDCVDFR